MKENIRPLENGLDRLKQLKELSDNLNQMKDGINPDSHVYLEKFKEAGKCFR